MHLQSIFKDNFFELNLFFFLVLNLNDQIDSILNVKFKLYSMYD